MGKSLSASVWSAAERAAWRPPPAELPSAWAERVLVLPPVASAEPGPLRLERTPYVRGVLDASADPETAEMTLVWSTQTAKSTTMVALLLRAVDQDPAPAMFVQAREEDVKSFSRSRVLPVMMESPLIRRHLPAGRRSAREMEILCDRSVIFFASARSPGALASRAVRYLFLDEVDKFPATAGAEADPIALATERTRTYWNHLIVKGTTPTVRAAYGWRELEKSNQHRFFVECPHCAARQVLSFSGEHEEGVPGPAGRITWPRDENGHALHHPDQVEADQLAWYECGSCARRWEEHQKPGIINRGQWRPLKKGQPRRHMGFHLWAAYSPWLTWSAIAAKFLRSRSAPEELRNFVNSWLAQPWEERGEVPAFEALQSRQVVYTQGATLRVGERMDETVLIDSGWDRPRGGEEGVNEDEVISLCDRWNFELGAGLFQPSKGASNAMSPPLNHWSRKYDRDRQGNALVGRLTLHRFYPDYFKLMLHSRLQRTSGRGGFWLPKPESFGLVPVGATHLTAGVDVHKVLQYWTVWAWGPGFTGWLVACGRSELWEEVRGCVLADYPTATITPEDAAVRLEEFMRQLRGEEMVTDARGLRSFKQTGLNHYLDASVLALVAAFKFRAALEAPPPPPADTPTPAEEQNAKPSRFQRFKEKRAARRER